MKSNQRLRGRIRAVSGTSALLAALGLGSLPAMAQVPDPVGRAEQAARSLVDERLRPDPRVEIERGRPVLEDAATPTREAVEGPVFTVVRIETNSTEVLPPETVRSLVAPYEGRNLSIGDIQRLVDEIDEAYRAIEFKAGFAVVPDQDLSTGVLQIVLVEPRVDQITASGLNRIKPDYIASRVPIHSGDLFDLNRLENNLNLMNRMSAGGVHVEALLQPGRDFGTTSLDIRLHEAPPAEITTVVDNYGARESGRYRPFTVLRLNNLAGRDDVLQFGLSGAVDDGASLNATSGFASYSVPIHQFTRLNVTASVSESEIDVGTFAPLELSTKSSFVGASVRTPLFSSERWLLAGETGAEVSFSETTTGPLLIDRRIRDVFGQVDATYYGDASGFQTSLRVSGFDARIDTNADSTLDRYVALSGGLFAYHRAGRFEGRLRGNWQWSPDDLLPATKQFTLGGPYSVRGYQIDQFSGDSGFYLGAEARVLLTDPERFGDDLLNAVQAVGFVDGGGVFPFRADGTTPLREDFATSIGVGLEAVAFRDQLTVFAGVAQPLDPVHEALHEDKPRFLFQAAFRVPIHDAPRPAR